MIVCGCVWNFGTVSNFYERNKYPTKLFAKLIPLSKSSSRADMATIKQFFVLTGDPGVGKTTMTKKLIDIMTEADVKSSGFFTEEVRRNRVREGFDVVTLDGQRGRLARDQSLLGPVKYKVGKYGVLVQEFESVALPSLLKTQDSSQLMVIDEIGKMEFFSEPFKSRIREIFSPSSDYVVLATIPVRKGDALIEGIRNNGKAKVWTITRENRNTIHEDIVKEMKNTFNC